jgi:hypothetical protein
VQINPIGTVGFADLGSARDQNGGSAHNLGGSG